jgi:UDP-2,3-diacylglucosamine hydrolase
MDDYFQKELNIPVYYDNQEYTFGDKTSRRRKRSRRYGVQTHEKVFTNPFSKWLFSWVHPDIGVRLQYLSVKNKLISGDEDITFLERTRNG